MRPGQLRSLEVTRHMAGITEVSLIDQSGSQVTLETNEGTMIRWGIEVSNEPDRTTLDFDEEYRTTKVTVRSHHRHTFRGNESGTTLQLRISDVDAGGVLGFAYRTFGRKNIGNALLAASKAHLDK